MDLKEAVKHLQEKKSKYAELKDVAAEAYAEVKAAEAIVYAELKTAGIKSAKFEFGSVGINEEWHVNLPETKEKEEELFKYLKENGGEYLFKVRADSLSTFFKQKWDDVKIKDPEAALSFALPGLEPAKLHETISLRKK